MREFSIIKQRILQYLELKGITKYNLYKETGMANGTLSQSNGLSEDNLFRFLDRFHDVNLYWLFRGEGQIILPQITGNPDARGYILPEGVEQNNVCDVTAAYGQAAGQTSVRVPIVEMKHAANGGRPDWGCIVLPADFFDSGVDLCIRIEDHSMHPTLQEGGYVFVRNLPRETWKDVTDNTICVMTLNDGTTLIRRIHNRITEEGIFLAAADNRNQQSDPVRCIKADEVVRLWETVGGITRKFPDFHLDHTAKLRNLEDDVDDLKRRMNRLLPSSE